MSKISIEQWRVFVAIVDNGGFAQAGEALFKSQSTISHSIKKLEGTLEKPVFTVSGRKAILTEFGASLVASARALVQHALELEHDAISHSVMAKQSLRIAVDVLFPKDKLYQATSLFLKDNPAANVDIYQTCLSRAGELLEESVVDLAVASRIPAGYLPQPLCDITLLPCCSKQHELANNSDLLLSDLARFRQVVIRDGGLRQSVNSGWLGSPDRITVSHFDEALMAVINDLGFAWFPTWYYEGHKEQLTPLPIAAENTRTVSLQSGINAEFSDLSLPSRFLSLLQSTPD